jgi:predicted glycosyltransferase
MDASLFVCPSRDSGAIEIAPSAARGEKRRVALYSHDTMGIGHMRRNLLIAQGLANGSTPVVLLLIAGAREVNAFGVPEGADCLSLPALHKTGNGRYEARHLDISLSELAALRGQSIAAALKAFAPDVLIVDKVPRGAVNELDVVLENLAEKGRTRCVLGLRDVLDDASTVREEWRAAANDDVIRRYYDAIWVYGDPTICNPSSEYGFAPDIAAKVRFTGYLDQRQRTRLSEIDGGAEVHALLKDSPNRLALCMVGGGQDGGRLAEAFARAVLPPGMVGVILTGPFMPPEWQHRLRCRAAVNSRLKILPFVTDPDLLLERVDRVVSMGGYNSVCDVLSFDKPALVVPRVHPRLEQLIRAERLQDLGMLDVLHPADLNPQALSKWLARDLPPRRPARERIDLNGLGKLPSLLNSLLSAPNTRTRRPRDETRLHNVIR